MTLGELSHAMGYTYSESTVRRALTLGKSLPLHCQIATFHFRDKSGMQDQLRQRRYSFAYLSLAECRLDR